VVDAGASGAATPAPTGLDVTIDTGEYEEEEEMDEVITIGDAAINDATVVIDATGDDVVDDDDDGRGAGDVNIDNGVNVDIVGVNGVRRGDGCNNDDGDDDGDDNDAPDDVAAIGDEGIDNDGVTVDDDDDREGCGSVHISARNSS
jgi:hypothetical protein